MNNESSPDLHERAHEHTIRDLFYLTEEQKTGLRERVEEFHGLVRVFVHPLAELRNGKEIENHGRVYNVLERSMASEKSPPIIILENEGGVEGWKLAASQYNLLKDLYIVPTLFDYPYPLVPGKPEPMNRDEKNQFMDEDVGYIEEGVKTLVEFLNGVGVKKVLVGGTRLQIIDGQINRCVGNFIKFMKSFSDMELKLSVGTAPLNREDVRESHPELL